MSKIVFKGQTPDKTPYLIRYPKRTDLNEFWRYINELSQEKTYINLQGEEVSLDEERKFLNNMIKKVRNKEIVFLAVESEGKIVGVADVTLKERAEKHVGVFGITLAQNFRGQGIGKILMEKVLEESRKKLKGLKIIRLVCFAENTGACKLYESFGFKEYGRLPGGLLFQNAPADEILMYKEI